MSKPIPAELAGRHASVSAVAVFLIEVNPNLPPRLATIANLFADLARDLLRNVNLDGPELTVALRKLLEAKDAAVRAAL